MRHELRGAGRQLAQFIAELLDRHGLMQVILAVLAKQLGDWLGQGVDEVKHALIDSGNADPGVDASYLTSLDAPFDWDEAQRRVRASTSPTN